ncbi:TDP-N-acetylfucosamine:lipid II N-acetylfucosaminyltransferase [Fusobacterium mortiferum]|uniref:TDP-N-acetylfucosamine:lipid II N-acetylfucosaminyltransferase n=1 Tax=Fusobacterium mortiferum TaxID=850 RepID=UPI00164DC9DD|nr:TDP-N-acetylfucosamine:lipid II N-acetylfucosaminyltransferase [Fusobacterium mortiferum]
MRKYYLHIMHNEKFINDFTKFINCNFEDKEHLFLIINGISEEILKINKSTNVIVYKSKDKNIIIEYINIINFLKKYSYGSKKIYIHGIFGKYLLLFFFIFRNYLKKSYWIIWGGDLYSYRGRKKGILRKIYYKIEKYVKGNFKGYITLMKGDYMLAQQWYGARGKLLYSFTYPSNLYKNIKIEQSKKEYLAIQIGNSAIFTNNHYEIFDKLEKYKEKNIKLYCPLSYGDKEYAKKIIERGKELFGEKFIPMTEFLEYSKYLEFLSEIDIAIFAHDRQQAFGNITSLLSMKKTIYIKEEISTYETLINLGINLKSFDKFENLEVLDEELLENNKRIIKEYFSEKKLKEQWENIFSD